MYLALCSTSMGLFKYYVSNNVDIGKGIGDFSQNSDYDDTGNKYECKSYLTEA